MAFQFFFRRFSPFASQFQRFRFICSRREEREIAAKLEYEHCLKGTFDDGLYPYDVCDRDNEKITIEDLTNVNQDAASARSSIRSALQKGVKKWQGDRDSSKSSKLLFFLKESNEVLKKATSNSYCRKNFCSVKSDIKDLQELFGTYQLPPVKTIWTEMREMEKVLQRIEDFCSKEIKNHVLMKAQVKKLEDEISANRRKLEAIEEKGVRRLAEDIRRYWRRLAIEEVKIAKLQEKLREKKKKIQYIEKTA